MSERGDWFITASGRKFFVLDPRPGAVCIEDIAHALAHICRYGGHSLRFYSVAQHSVIVSRIVPEHLALAGLMHDAAEAYCGDVIRPIKRVLSNYAEIEALIEAAIRARFGMPELNAAQHAFVKHADNVALVTERRDLVAPHAWAWKEEERGYRALDERIEPLEPAAARALFIRRFRELTEHA